MLLTHFQTHPHQQEQPLLSPKWKKGVEVAGAAAFPDSPVPAGAASPVTQMEKGSRSCRSSSLSSHPNEEETTHALASFHASMSDVLNVSDAFPDSPAPAGAASPVTQMEKGSRSSRSNSLSSHPNEEETICRFESGEDVKPFVLDE